MSETQRSDEISSVLRPFEELSPDPLPPVEPSKVVPEERAPEIVDDITPDDVVNAATEPPIEGEVPDIDAVEPEAEADEPDIEDIWAAVESEAGVDETLDALAPDEDVTAEETVLGDAATDDALQADDDLAPDDDLAIDDDVAGDHAPAPMAGNDGPGPAETVTLPRKPFLIGLGAVGLVVIVLLALWQTAGGDDPAPFAQPAPTADTTAPVEPDAGDPPAAPVDDGSVALQAEIQGLNAQLEVLQGELADVPPPALAGSSILRIPVASGSKFVSATDASVAVVGPFGNYANINPDTDTVTAAGNISGGATRVMRTETSVWVTDYSNNKLVQIDPLSNTIAAEYAFPGPDGLAKWEDSLLVASFDGNFLGVVNPTTGEPVGRIDLGGSPTDVLVAENRVWVALFDTGEVLTVDPAALEVVDRVLVGAGPVSLTRTAAGIWSANHNEGTVARIDVETGQVTATVEVGEGPTGIHGARGSLWVTVTDAGELAQVDIDTGEIVTVTPLGGPAGGGPVGIDKTTDSLWIAMDGEDSVVRVALPD